MKAWIRDVFGVLNGFRKFTVEILLLALAIMIFVVGLVLIFMPAPVDYANYINLINAVSGLLVGPTVAFYGVNGLEHAMKTAQEWLAKKKK